MHEQAEHRIGLHGRRIDDEHREDGDRGDEEDGEPREEAGAQARRGRLGGATLARHVDEIEQTAGRAVGRGGEGDGRQPHAEDGQPREARRDAHEREEERDDERHADADRAGEEEEGDGAGPGGGAGEPAGEHGHIVAGARPRAAAL